MLYTESDITYATNFDANTRLEGVACNSIRKDNLLLSMALQWQLVFFISCSIKSSLL